MPTRRKYKRRRRRRKRRYRLSRRKRLPPLGFPNDMVARLRMAGTLTLDASAGTLASRRIACNIAHEPDPNNTSRELRHYRVYAGVYNRYKVIGAKLNVRVVGPGSTQVNTQAIGIMINDTGILNAPNTTIVDLLEDPKMFGKSRIIRHDMAGTPSMTSKWSIKRLAGKKHDSDDVLDGLTGNTHVAASAPSRKEYFCVWAGRAGYDLLDPQPITLSYTLEYLVKFWDYNEKLPLG